MWRRDMLNAFLLTLLLVLLLVLRYRLRVNSGKFKRKEVVLLSLCDVAGCFIGSIASFALAGGFGKLNYILPYLSHFLKNIV